MAKRKTPGKSQQPAVVKKKAKPTLHFWGVRGSIPTPGVKTRKIGGNTACVELRSADARLIFDAGTGLRELGLGIIGESNTHFTILLSHYHWDHLLGLPFFTPIFKPDSVLDIYGEHKEGGGPKEALQRQFAGPSFPVEFSALPSKLHFHEVKPGDSFTTGSIRVDVGRLNHPNAAICYRATVQGKSVVYASDHEHDGSGDADLIAFAKGADVLVYDAMYADAGYGARKGWGHSTWEEGVRVAKAAKVKKLYLYHHDPANDDAAMEKIGRAAKKLFAGAEIAREGFELVL